MINKLITALLFYLLLSFSLFSQWQIFNVGSTFNLKDVSVVNTNIIWVCGETSSVYFTNDGGVNWVQINNNLQKLDLDKIIALDSNIAWVTSDSAIFKTTNRGVSWVRQYHYPGLHIKEGTPAENNENEFPMLVVGNIGYYKEGHFTEFHKLMPFVLKDKNDSIIEKLKRDPDFSEGQALSEAARSHLDDKHIVNHFDVDDIINVQSKIKGYVIGLVPAYENKENIMKLGYQFTDLKKM